MYIGIDLGGTHIAAGLVDENGIVVKKESSANCLGRDYKEVVKDMADLCQETIKDSGFTLKEIKSIGIGIPGIANDEKGTVTCISTLKFDNAPIRKEFKKHINALIKIENDANCAALAESIAGAARGTRVSVAITLGTGIGGGIIIDNKVFSGFNFAGSEMGHNVIVVDGEQCTCGRKGCWEAYSSGPALIKEAQKALQGNKTSIIYEMVHGDMSKIDGKIIFDAAKKGDIIAQNVVSVYTKYLAEGISNIINIIMPEVLVIGGGISQQGDYLLDLLKPKVYQSIYTKNEPKTKLKIAELSVDAGLVGAAMLGK